MRGLIRNVLIQTPELMDLMSEQAVFGSGSIGNPDQENHDVPLLRPFAELRFSINTPGMARVTRRRLEIWFHDDRGSYNRIDRCISIVRDRMDGLAQVEFEDPDTGENSQLILAEWVSDSTDLYDTGYRTNCRSTGYDLIGKDK